MPPKQKISSISKPAIPANEKQRIETLRHYSILDGIQMNEYDDITRLTAYICNTPISLVTLVDETRVWFKSHYGIEENSAPRDIAFCAHAINDPEKMMIVPDSRIDERFFDNPFVNGDANIVFYAGIPLVTSEGDALGTLCVLDRQPRKLDDKQIEAIKLLSKQVIRLFEARKNTKLLKLKMLELEQHNKALHDFARVAAHDIKSPLYNIIQLTSLLKTFNLDTNHPEALNIIDMTIHSAEKLAKMIDGILEYSRNSKVYTSCKQNIQLLKAVKDIELLLNHKPDTEFIINIDETIQFFVNKVALEQILINLITNALKFIDKPKKIIKINAALTDNKLILHIIDNGPGIKEEDRERIFRLFETSSKEMNGGLGIGLATVKSLVENLGGSISVHSVSNEGSDFEIVLPR
jgi:signal transduction histidine kinase